MSLKLKLRFAVACIASAAAAFHFAIAAALLVRGDDLCIIWLSCTGMYAYVAYSNLLGSWGKDPSW